MPNTLFVCYRHGCRGENMAHRISQHPLFRTLVADKVNGRTIIRNDFFDKKFIAQRDMVRLDKLQLPAENILLARFTPAATRTAGAFKLTGRP